jgi:mRNA interferase MazF
MDIHQGDIFWLQITDIPHPHVVVQVHDSAVTLCALTSNLQRISLPGNILLEAGEANLPKPSVVEVSKIATVAPAQLGDYIGSLSAQRMQQIQSGIRFVQTSFLNRN